MSEYDTDLLLWSERQADLLRKVAAGERVNDQVDWKNVAEEIESLGRSERRQLHNRIASILVHLIKLEASPAEEPRTGWRETVLEQRRHLSILLKESPSLRSAVPLVVTEELDDAKAQATIGLQRYHEPPRVDPAGLGYFADHVLGPFLP
jgi:hypothetical protein